MSSSTALAEEEISSLQLLKLDIEFNGIPVTAARWPRASNAASRHWLLFLRASVTIDVISDSQPWMGVDNLRLTYTVFLHRLK
ncbi:hypothetical protein EYF80_027728 [Liparis tanakae]|uniref:Uncharacterized protein n=1 Tax=Liparis tanakae TaxID=230148 RepID=A0A4Z2H816_9TELE|nr:hypothetical protein EYF80_027728 [Liparis tanakae]